MHFRRRWSPLLCVMLLCCAGCPAKPQPPGAGTTGGSNAAAGTSSAVQSAGTPAAATVDDDGIQPVFAAVAKESGVEFVYRDGQEAGHAAILESLGGGVAIIDFDKNTRPDLLAVVGGPYREDRSTYGFPTGLFRAVVDGQYRNTTEAAAMNASPHYAHGAAAADYDADGFTDVLITGYGGVVLWHNLGDGTFNEVAVASGLTDSSWSSSAAWTDIDGDGNLDVYLAHYINWSFENHPECLGPNGQREVCPPRRFDPLPHSLYRSTGGGQFVDHTQVAGLRSDGKGLGVVTADMDLDGDQDIYVGNDTVPNFLYRNRGDGTLEDMSLASGTSLSAEGTLDGSMGVDVGDFDRDGQPDIWVANYERESFALYKNLGDFFFRHASRETGVMALAGLYVGWGTAFSNLDLDGDEDIIASNGHVIRFPTNSPLQQNPILFENRNGRFVNVAAQAGNYFTQAHHGRGLATSDLDGDGDQDAVISRVNQLIEILRNDIETPHHWLTLRLIGRDGNRSAIGAVVRVTAAGSPMLLRQVRGGGSYASTSDLTIHVGLATAETASIAIDWPGEGEQTFADVAADTAYIASQSHSQLLSIPK